jgi:hypothetical protein
MTTNYPDLQQSKLKLEYLRIVLSSKTNPHQFINVIFSRLFSNPEDTNEYNEFVQSKNFESKLKILRDKLFEKNYKLHDFSNLIANNLEFAPDETTKNSILEQLKIEYKNLELPGGKFYIRPVTKDTKITKTTVRFILPKRQENLINQYVQSLNVDISPDMSYIQKIDIVYDYLKNYASLITDPFVLIGKLNKEIDIQDLELEKAAAKNIEQTAAKASKKISKRFKTYVQDIKLKPPKQQRARNKKEKLIVGDMVRDEFDKKNIKSHVKRRRPIILHDDDDDEAKELPDRPRMERLKEEIIKEALEEEKEKIESSEQEQQIEAEEDYINFLHELQEESIKPIVDREEEMLRE